MLKWGKAGAVDNVEAPGELERQALAEVAVANELKAPTTTTTTTTGGTTLPSPAPLLSPYVPKEINSLHLGANQTPAKATTCEANLTISPQAKQDADPSAQDLVQKHNEAQRLNSLLTTKIDAIVQVLGARWQ
jgi:hypothetical protein